MRTQRSCYPRPLTEAFSGSFEHFTSSQLAHEDELEAQRNEIEKDNAAIERAERKRDEEDDDFGLGSQELYQQWSSQSTEDDDDRATPVARRRSVDEYDSDDTSSDFQSSQPSSQSDATVYRTREEILRDDKGITSGKIVLINAALNRDPADIPSPARRRCAKNIIAVLYGLEASEIDLIEWWIRHHEGHLETWPFGENR
ncbi:hypothetical protein BV22DRAFT_130365 [Leucogyrophana mollusca]|uniref:Uncharacterized protein n=1 Tax=Leucogyrophana mollusca TaxID=85980 RepID=A0ACB8BTQ1_9AGAM|nr:hypothetical protein BV22DRAFT_130365 [Leucogyrophana mollusca]